jgi:hypothetical protein
VTAVNALLFPLSAGFGGRIGPGGRFCYDENVAKAKPNYVRHGVQFFRHVVPEVVRPMRSLWNEIIGFLFLSLAFLGAVSGFRIYRHFDGSAETFFRIILVSCFVVIMTFYGITSFLRARKISRS